MCKALYPLSGDPIHNGHLEIIKKAASVFEEVVVGFAINEDKKGLFTLNERLDLAEQALKHLGLTNVKVAYYKGLTVDYAKKHGINYLVRGVRNIKDFAYEQKMALVNNKICPSINTILFLTDIKFQNISSSLVKNLSNYNCFITKDIRNVLDYIPMNVKKALEIKQGQYIIGITGEIAAGKSFVAERLVTLFKMYKHTTVHILELDDIAHAVLGIEKDFTRVYDDEEFKATRIRLVEVFGKEIMMKNGCIQRKVLGKKIWGIENRERNKEFNKIMGPPVLRLVREKLQYSKGIILFITGILVEENLSSICNNDVVLIHSKDTIINKRMAERGLSEKEISKRKVSMLCFEEKKALLDKKIKKDGTGHLWEYDSSTDLEPLAKNILIYLEVKT